MLVNEHLLKLAYVPSKARNHRCFGQRGDSSWLYPNQTVDTLKQVIMFVMGFESTTFGSQR